MEDIFRPEYRELSPEEKQLVDDIKTKAKELYDLIELASTPGPSATGRYLALAKTSLEESIMWATKGITGPK